jgi:mono/diheme cytochrome c family protein
MKHHLLFFIAVIFCCSCNTKQKWPKQQVLATANIPLQLYEIDPGMENSIRTQNGATVRFPKDAFMLNGTGKVQVRIQEAYTMKDILKAGLVTEADGKPLTSSGMIYLNAQQDGKDISLKQKAGISIPVSNYNENMQLYKGEYTADSSINWVQPTPLDTIPTVMIAAGKSLFLQNCAACHSIQKSTTGPALYDILNRVPSKEWLYAYTRNWEEAFSFKDSTGFNYRAYSCCISTYSPSTMNKFPQLSDAALDALYGYIQYESDKNPLPGFENPAKICLPCLTAKPVTVALPGNWDSTNTQLYIPNEDTPIIKTPENKPADPTELEKGFRTNGFTDAPETFNYQFSIETLGWYNVDAEMAGLPGTEYCALSATINNKPKKAQLNIYLVIPAKKNLSVCNEEKNGVYYFNKVNGKIPLHLDDKAFLIAFGEEDGKLIYGIKPFITKLENKLNITLSTTTENAFVKNIAALGMEGLQFTVKKSDPVLLSAPELPGQVTLPDGSKAEQSNTNTPIQNPAIKDTVKYVRWADSTGSICPCGYNK